MRGCFVTDCQLNRIWRRVVLSLQMSGFVWPGAVMWKTLSTCFSPALWPLVRLWIGFEWEDTQVISDHFSQFKFYTGGLKSRRSFLELYLAPLCLDCVE
jgi:hypothetical protein